MSERGDVRAVEPLARPPDVTVTLPGSKSITNRALVAAALAEGTSTLTGALVADDTEAMAAALAALGYDIALDRHTARVRVVGRGPGVPPGPATLDARQSGTTARFLAPLLALGPGPYRLDGHPQLRARPMGPLIDGLRALGAGVSEPERAGHLPVDLAGGGLAGGRAELPGHVSSQFLSGLLLAAPLAARSVEVALTTPPVSVPYLELTRAVMTAFGGPGVEVGPGHRRFVVGPGRYQPCDYAIEPDASAAAYFAAAAAITGGRVRVEGLHGAGLQGDWAFADVLAAMGARVERTDGAITVSGRGPLHGIEVDLRHLSDTAPTLAVVAAFAQGPTRVTGIGFIRAKESDRIGAVVHELRRLGADADEEPDGFVVRPAPLRGGRVATYDDHRMAMSFALAGLVVPGVGIADPGCVGKTFPGFWAALDRLRW